MPRRRCGPSGVLHATLLHVGQRGALGREATVLWPGVLDQRGTAVVTTAWIPRGGGEGGAADEAERLALALALEREGWELIGQVRTLQREAGQWRPDAQTASGRNGAVTIVLPWYGARFDPARPDFAGYELECGRWREWSSEERAGRLAIVPTRLAAA